MLFVKLHHGGAEQGTRVFGEIVRSLFTMLILVEWYQMW